MALIKTTNRMTSGAVINVLDFGATGNGTTDDGPAIRAAVAAAAGLNSVYFPAGQYYINSSDASASGYGLVIRDIHTKLIGAVNGGPGDKVALVAGPNITNSIVGVLDGQTDGIIIEGLFFNADNNADYCFYTNDASTAPYMRLQNVRFHKGNVANFRSQGIVWEIDNCQSSNSGIGWQIFSVGQPNTSLVINATYAKECTTGYDFDFLTYCSFNALACDNCDVAYDFSNLRGSSINGCGAEGCTEVMYLRSTYAGVSINGFYMLGCGGDATKSLFNTYYGNNLTVSGLAHTNPQTYNYFFDMKDATSKVTFLDKSVPVEEVNSIGRLPIFTGFVQDQDPTSFPITISTASSLKDLADSLRFFEVNDDYTISLASGTYELDGLDVVFQNIKGSGNLIIQGATGTPSDVVLNTAFRELRFDNASCRVTLKDLQIEDDASNGSYDRLRFTNCPNVFLENVVIDANGVNARSAVTAINSKVFVDADTIAIGGSYFQDAVWLDLGGGEFIYANRSAAPSSGSWDVGNKIYHSSPAASGNIGFVCVTAGSPGTWKTFGAISS